MSILFVILQYVLPKHLLTALVYRVARIRRPGIKNFLIRAFVRAFDVDVDEVLKPVPDGFKTFNEFFIRELDAGERPVDDRDEMLVSPVDGTVSIAGSLQGGMLVQVKGMSYSLEELLATDLENAHAYDDGQFATIYLAPYNYHRVHAPIDGSLVAARYVPGDLFSVSAETVARVRGLFRRNERLVLHFDTPLGPAAVILVGALNVGSISTPWTGEIRPRANGVVEALDISAHSADVRKGDLLGWFNMGSTVILLLPRAACEWNDDLEPGETVRMGEAIAKLVTADD
jgi:phosphatidylserine decarboxylase